MSASEAWHRAALEQRSGRVRETKRARPRARRLELDKEAMRRLVRERGNGQLALPGFTLQLPCFSERDQWAAWHEAQLALIAPEKQPEALCDVADLEASLRLSAAGAQSVLELGCGLHPMGPFLAVQLGVPRVVCVDASRPAVLAMRGKFGSVGGLRFFEVDAERLVRNLEAACVWPQRHAPQLDIVLDKGMLDCLFTRADHVAVVRRLSDDIYALLRPGGCFISVTRASALLREPYFDRAAWSVASAPVPERRCTVLTFTKLEPRRATIGHGRFA